MLEKLRDNEITKITKKSPIESDFKFNCKKCDYHTNNKKDFNKHLATIKHKRKQVKKMDNIEIPKCRTCPHYSCTRCGKKYMWSSGLSKHKKKCERKAKQEAKEKMVEGEADESEKKTAFYAHLAKEVSAKVAFLEARIKELELEARLKELEKGSHQNVDSSGSGIVSEVRDLFRDQNMTLTKLVKNQKDVNENLHQTLKEIIPTIGNNNNNRISINVFLNQHCKDAMNLTDFVDKIKISIKDLHYTKENGYVEGISNIFRKHLTDMKPTERPFHCSDTKRLQFYVREENKWAKDTKNIKMDRTIQDISIKQIKHLKEWEKKHPGYLEDEELRTEWHGLVEAMCRPENQIEGDKIKKNLGDTSEVKNELIGKNTIISIKDK